MRIDEAMFRRLVAEANLAPSVHNIQPTRWRLTREGDVLVFEDPVRRLPVGDPEGRDLGVSHGCAVEGFRIAATRADLRVTAVPEAGAVARLRIERGDDPDPLSDLIGQRRTWRGRFEPDRRGDAALAPIAADAPDLIVVSDAEAIAAIAGLYDDASLRWFRNAPYRAELLSWMRLSRRHSGWARDGLNAEAMEMSAVEAAGAGFVLRSGVFELLDRVGAAGWLVAEAPVVRTASAIALFHRPVGEPPFETGRRFYRAWLAFTAEGLSASPMAVLADDPSASATLAAEFEIPSDRRLITAFRLGVGPVRSLGPKPRLPIETLIV